MIHFLESNLVFYPILSGVFVSEILYLVFTYNSSPNCKREAVIRRMAAYSNLKSPNLSEKATPINGFYLTSGAHEVLLGTLKKVEAKSAALTSVIVFSLTIFIGSIVASGTYDNFDRLLAILATCLILPLIFSFRGIYQLDQSDFRKTTDYDSDPKRVSKALQGKLMDDLISKERSFRFSRKVTMFSISILLLILVLQVMIVPIRNPSDADPNKITDSVANAQQTIGANP